MTDDPLAHEPFSFRSTKDGRILISFEGRVVTTVAGAAAERLATKLRSADAAGVQQLLARATGNFKRGNERTQT
jgi:hypothetical protein